MTVRIRSGLGNFVARVAAHLERAGVTAKVLVGARALPRQDQGPGGANRIVIVPYDPKSGDAGELLEPGNVGDRDIMSGPDDDDRVGTVRALADWDRRMLVSVWAIDEAKPEDELLQEEALEQLLEDALRAIHAAGLADVRRGRIQRTPATTRQFGAEARFELRFTQPLFDHVIDVGFPDAEVTKA